jgi:hypothetical protein
VRQPEVVELGCWLQRAWLPYLGIEAARFGGPRGVSVSSPRLFLAESIGTAERENDGLRQALDHSQIPVIKGVGCVGKNH